VDVKRVADLYAQGWTLRQIGAELGVTATTVSHQLRRAGVTMRRGGASAHPASTQQILELRDQGLTWPEIAEQVDMTVSGAWSRYRRAMPSKPPRLGRWQQVLADGLAKNLAIGVRAAVADHLGRSPEPSWADRGRTSRPSSRRSRSCPRASCAQGRHGRLIQATATTWSWQSRT
jgi:lambda repressor-like predicted transcriptional regulator